MHRLLALAFPCLALAALSCGTSTSGSNSEAWPPQARPELSPTPKHVKVSHVLFSFQGAGTAATRSKAEAEQLAKDVYRRATGGEDFNTLMKQSDDTGGGTYSMCNEKIDLRPMEISRSGMVKGFGDVSFSLNVGEIGVCVYDPAKSKYGWHIVKRLE